MRFFLIGLVVLVGCSSTADPDVHSNTAAATGAGASGGGSPSSSGSAGSGGDTGGAGGDAGAGAVGPCMPSAKSGELVWAKRAGGSGWDVANGVATSADGSITVTGNFDGAAAFSPDDPDKTILYPVAVDMYAARYDASGAIVWAKRAGGPPIDAYDVTSGNGAASMADGSTVIAGEFEALATFGEGEPAEVTLQPQGTMDAFVAHYGVDGSVGWVRPIGGAGVDQAFAIASSPDGSAIALSGRFQGTATFGTGPGATTVTSNGGNDAFVTVYGEDGSFSWTRGIGGTADDDVGGLAVAYDGSVFVTGTFFGTITLGATEPNETTLVGSPINGSMFLARFGPSGDLVWAKTVTGDSSVRGVRLGLAGRGIVVLGFLDATATFGAGEPSATTLTSAGSDDVFVARFHDDGTFDWARRAGGDGVDYPRGLAFGQDGAIYVSGTFEAETQATFGEAEGCEASLVRTGDIDLFLARYVEDGSFVWVRHAGGTTLADHLHGGSLAIAADGSVVVAGAFVGSATFGLGESNETTLDSASADIFLAKYLP